MKVELIEGLTELLEGSPACGLTEDGIVYVDANASKEIKRLSVIHEVLEMWLGKRIKHSKFDRIALDIIDALKQIGEVNYE